MTLARTQARARAARACASTCPVITVAGTNGKGSTCAMLESIALAAGYRVGLYIKPHLVHFEERCRIDGVPVAADALLPHFEAVEAARGDITLTYFEFTTLAIMRCLSQQRLDLVILEVGLGGRLDAVNAIDADCAVITSIDIDHIEYLGPDRESIGFEKAASCGPASRRSSATRCRRASVVAHAQAIGADLWLVGRDFNHGGDRQQWHWAGRGKRIGGLAYPALRGANQLLNAAGVLAAFEALRERLPVPAQAVRQGLAVVELPGRFQIVPGEPTWCSTWRTTRTRWRHWRPISMRWASSRARMRCSARCATRTSTAWCSAWRRSSSTGTAPICRCRARRAPTRWLQVVTRNQGRAIVSTHASPSQALAAALEHADPADRILVFGSFLTVGGVLESGLPRFGSPAFGITRRKRCCEQRLLQAASTNSLAWDCSTNSSIATAPAPRPLVPKRA